MRGGKRSGAGRPKGARNAKTVEQLQAIRDTGLTPLAYLASIYQDPQADEAKRIDAAKAAAPYVHARLSAIEHSGEIATSQPYDLSGISDKALGQLEGILGAAQPVGGDTTGARAPKPGSVH